MKRICRLIFIISTFFYYFSVQTPVNADTLHGGNNCMDLPLIPVSVNPTTGTMNTEFKVTLGWNQLSADDFQKYQYTSVYIRILDVNGKLIPASRDIRDDAYARTQQEKTHVITSFVLPPGTHTLSINLSIDPGGICSSYQANTTVISVSSTFVETPTPTPRQAVCSKINSDCTFDSECETGNECSTYKCINNFCIDANPTSTPIPTPTRTPQLKLGQQCNPELQTTPDFACPSTIPCEQAETLNIYRCGGKTALDLEARCNTVVDYRFLPRCQTPKINSTERCGEGGKGYVCKDKKEVLCMNITYESERSETNVVCEKLPSIAQPCKLYVKTDQSGNALAMTEQEKKDLTEAVNKNQVPANTPYKCAEIDSAIGGIQTDPAEFVKKIFSIVLSMAGGIALLLIIVSGYNFMMSQGDAEKVKGAKETLTSAIVGLLFIIFSMVLLQVIGVYILKIPGFK